MEPPPLRPVRSKLLSINNHQHPVLIIPVSHLKDVFHYLSLKVHASGFWLLSKDSCQKHSMCKWHFHSNMKTGVDGYSLLCWSLLFVLLSLSSFCHNKKQTPQIYAAAWLKPFRTRSINCTNADDIVWASQPVIKSWSTHTHWESCDDFTRLILSDRGTRCLTIILSLLSQCHHQRLHTTSCYCCCCCCLKCGFIVPYLNIPNKPIKL